MSDGLFPRQMFPTTLAVVAVNAVFDALSEMSPILNLNEHVASIMIFLAGATLYMRTIKGGFDSIDTAFDKATEIDGAPA